MAKQVNKLGLGGLQILKHYEQGPKGGFAPLPYQDDAGYWTWGYGHKQEKGEALPTAPLDSAGAEALLTKDAQARVDIVNKHVTVALNQNQFDACVCLVYNIGEGNFATSTLLRLLNTGLYASAAAQFAPWNKLRDRKTGQLVVAGGLVSRRKTEALLFTDGVVKFFN
jgi:lysozyme